MLHGRLLIYCKLQRLDETNKIQLQNQKKTQPFKD